MKPRRTIPIHFIENLQQEQENHGQKCPQAAPSVFLPVQDAITSPLPIITIRESSDNVIPSRGNILPIRENANRIHFEALSKGLSAIKTTTVVQSVCNGHPIQLICISQDAWYQKSHSFPSVCNHFRNHRMGKDPRSVKQFHKCIHQTGKGCGNKQQSFRSRDVPCSFNPVLQKIRKRQTLISQSIPVIAAFPEIGGTRHPDQWRKFHRQSRQHPLRGSVF